MKKLYFATWEPFIARLHKLQGSRFLKDYERVEIEKILQDAESKDETTRQQDEAVQLFSRAAQRRALRELGRPEPGKPRDEIKIDD